MPTPNQQINVTISPAMHANLGVMAKKAGLPLSTYASQLLTAAYSARVKPPSGDLDLDAAVGLATVLYAEGRNTAEIAKAVGLKEATVVEILGAWREAFRDGGRKASRRAA